ncbi:hypothetical protein CBF34_06820 [Vagococcus penaei]|uniref:Uncharacterized protein n=1 Tax=Vagococcus penaei TaxID=633807 RepID=A0A1Q2D3G5_9ENTE|nr:MmcQ/YjbR family DNA-binding protein [Vagococcus penaei]AQP52877.1 hypothetical protein BW732_00655 [Vagococcus penaei]RSU01366.1 hypothetical protein CBF34_06820 [Vagococcus penaei]
MIKAIESKLVFCKEYGQTLPGATVTYRPDWGTVYFSVNQKQFGLMTPESTPASFITLKNDPDKNVLLREMFPEVITPGYYTNKKHWNSILLSDDEVTNQLLQQLIKESYDLVFKKLTKKDQQIILAHVD